MPIAPDRNLNFGLDAIVHALRATRIRSLELRQREQHPPKLPSKLALKDIIEGLSTALYPNRLGAGTVTDEGIDYYVGNTLDENLRQLQIQIQRELRFHQEQAGNFNSDRLKIADQAHDRVRSFAKILPAVRELLDTDLKAAFEGDPAARSIDEILVCYPGMAAITHHRLAHELYRLDLPVIARIISEVAHSATGIDIHPGAQIGPGFFIDHGTGVVIGETTIIGARVRLYQAVTLGAKRFPADEHGMLLKGHPRHPILEDEVVVYAGATILGRITIGKGSTIGGNVWLTHSVGPESNITQAAPRQEHFIHGAGI